MLKLCIRHGHHDASTGCAECRAARGTTNQRGYGAAWQRLSAEARRRQPYCSKCGATRDLTVDHRDPRKRTGLTLADVDVLCRPCNARKGGARQRPATDAAPPAADRAPLIA
jgi:5-methylcytosine-specific restriction protein A